MRRTVVAVAFGLVAWVVVAFLILELVRWRQWDALYPADAAPWAKSLYVLIQLGVPSAVGWLVGARIALHRGTSSLTKPAGRGKLWALRIAIMAYGLTAVFGVPAVLNDRFREAPVPAMSGPLAPKHAYSRAIAGMAVAPGVVLVYHEYQIGNAMGASGFYLYLWDGVGTHRIADWLLWIS